MTKKIKPLFNELPPIKAPEEEISMFNEEIEIWFNEVCQESKKSIMYRQSGSLFKAIFDRMMKTRLL